LEPEPITFLFKTTAPEKGLLFKRDHMESGCFSISNPWIEKALLQRKSKHIESQNSDCL